MADPAGTAALRLLISRLPQQVPLADNTSLYPRLLRTIPTAAVEDDEDTGGWLAFNQACDAVFQPKVGSLRPDGTNNILDGAIVRGPLGLDSLPDFFDQWVEVIGPEWVLCKVQRISSGINNFLYAPHASSRPSRCSRSPTFPPSLDNNLALRDGPLPPPSSPSSSGLSSLSPTPSPSPPPRNTPSRTRQGKQRAGSSPPAETKILPSQFSPAQLATRIKDRIYSVAPAGSPLYIHRNAYRVSYNGLIPVLLTRVKYDDFYVIGRFSAAYLRLPDTNDQDSLTWGCGYTAGGILHHYITVHFCDAFTPKIGVHRAIDAPLPSFATWQRMLTKCWEEGFGTESIPQFPTSIVASDAWLGASDFFYIFSHMGFRTHFHTFTRDHDSSGNVGAAVVEYLIQHFGIRLHMLRQQQLAFVEPLDCPFVALAEFSPVFVQYQGHSFTVVGITCDREGAFSLVVFDPNGITTSITQVPASDGLKFHNLLAGKTCERPTSTWKGPMTPYLMPARSLKEEAYQILYIDSAASSLFPHEKRQCRSLTNSNLNVTHDCSEFHLSFKHPLFPPADTSHDHHSFKLSFMESRPVVRPPRRKKSNSGKKANAEEGSAGSPRSKGDVGEDDDEEEEEEEVLPAKKRRVVADSSSDRSSRLAFRRNKRDQV